VDACGASEDSRPLHVDGSHRLGEAQVTKMVIVRKAPHEGRVPRQDGLPVGSYRRGTAVAVELADLIGQLRAELTEAMRSGDGTDLRFEVGPVELELTVAVSKETKPGAKVKIWVAEAGVEGKLESSTTQRIKSVLDPRQMGQPGHKPLISGTEVDGER
jgi:hypothetical protein